MTATSTPVGFSRRHFLIGSGAVGLATMGMPSVMPRIALASPDDPSSGDVLVCIFLRGGADGLSLVPPFSDTAGYQTLRGAGTSNDLAVPPPNAADPANTAIDLATTVSGHSFGLHPAATGLKAIWDAGDLAIVHAVGMPAGESDTRSHFDAETFWEHGSANPAVETGWLARHLLTTGPWSGIPGLGYDTGGLPMSLRGESKAMGMSSIDGFHVEGFDDIHGSEAVFNAVYPAGSGDTLTQQGHDTLAAVAQVTAANPAQYDDNAGLYQSTGPGRWIAQGLKEVAQLIRANVGIRVACLDVGGWDMHNAMGPVNSAQGAMRQLTKALSDAIRAFHQDLGPLMDEVTLVTMSEFGRTIGGNGSGGTDHGRGNALFVVGRNVNRGIYGAYPTGALADGPEGDLAVTTDFRTVLSEILVKRLGNANLAQVFPGYSHPGHLGVVS